MSSEKQYKYIEEKIKEAADAADYAFNEASWKKMKALLDKKKDKRRPFFWVFGALLLGVLVLGGGIIYQAVNKNDQSQITKKLVDNKNSDKNEKDVYGADKITIENTASPGNKVSNTATPASDNINTGKDLITIADDAQGKPNTYRQKTAKQNPVTDFTAVIKLNSKNAKVKNIAKTNNDDNDNYNAANKNVYKDKNKFAVKINTPEMENDKGNNENKTAIDTDDTSADTNETKIDLRKPVIAKPDETAQPDTTLKKTNTTTKPENKKDKRNKPISGFYLVGAIGAEASSAKLLSYKNGSITPVYGAGLGYRFNKRISLQTGFYAGAKKYVAGPGDYYVKPGSYLSTVKIIKVDANCMVYEVPLTLQYNWLIKPKTNYFATIGLSSYIMKKEKYNYTFEIYNTQYTYPYIYTKNTHLLSSLQFSLGIEKQIAPTLFIQAAPTIALPLQGVGEGSVKIFTTRLQIGLKYLPFRHK